MPYRVLPEDWAAVDPDGVARAMQGNNWAAPWVDRPGQSRQEYYVSEAMRIMTVPSDVIRQARPPVPQQLLPPIEGYDTTPLTINEVLDTNRWEPQWRSWVSGVVRYPRKSDAQDEMWSGTTRNVNASQSPGM
jgi:hypothetical protein